MKNFDVIHSISLQEILITTFNAPHATSHVSVCVCVCVFGGGVFPFGLTAYSFPTIFVCLLGIFSYFSYIFSLSVIICSVSWALNFQVKGRFLWLLMQELAQTWIRRTNWWRKVIAFPFPARLSWPLAPTPCPLKCYRFLNNIYSECSQSFALLACAWSFIFPSWSTIYYWEF